MTKDMEINISLILGSIGLAIIVTMARKPMKATPIEERFYDGVPIETAIEEVVVGEAYDVEYILQATEAERDLMARVVMSEASILPIEGKQAVAQVIVNRVRSNRFPNNIEAVCNQPYQFSQADNGTPDAECYEAVEAALKYEGFPPNMFYFRTGGYFTWAEDYIQIRNTYFSLGEDTDE